LLMWAHYADCHHGAVIEFRNVAGKNSALCGSARAIAYQATIPAVADIAEEWAAHISGESRIDMNAAFLKMAFTKSDHWSYEKEWRCWNLARPGDDRLAEPIRVDAEDFAAVYLGSRRKPDDQHAMAQIVRESPPHVQLYQPPQ